MVFRLFSHGLPRAHLSTLNHCIERARHPIHFGQPMSTSRTEAILLGKIVGLYGALSFI